MYFHLIWLKEKEGKQYELDCLIKWWDENFIRDFMSTWWAVVVSISEYKDDDISSFWNILLATVYKNTEIQIIISGEDLSERLYYFAMLWLAPQVFNFINNPIPEPQMQELIKNTFIKIKEDNEIAQEQAEKAQKAEANIYEDKSIKNWLKALNDNIDYMEQILKIWQWIISWLDSKTLQNMIEEMKKIRLWTNFNKMAEVIFDAQDLVWRLEEQIFQALDDKKFLIDRNSYITNIDVIKECFKIKSAKDKTTFDPTKMWLEESIYGFAGPVAAISKFTRKDVTNIFKASSANDLFDVLMELIEYFSAVAIFVISALFVISPIFKRDFSLYALPAFGWLWLLIYLFNSLKFKKLWTKIIAFVILALIYRYGLVLLKNTFVF